MADPVLLDGRAGQAIAKICLLFGYSFRTDRVVITETVFHLIQGWALQVDVEDWETQEQACHAFIGQMEVSEYRAMVLETAALGPKLREAFKRGVQQGVQALLKEKSVRSKA